MRYNFDPADLVKNPPIKTPGYCLCIDIVGSTALKDRPFAEWVSWLNNGFVNMLSLGIEPLKIIGDCAMFYCEDSQLAKRNVTILDLFAGLIKIVGELDNRLYPDVKISVAFCQEVFEFSFLTDTPDFYGKDIDLTFRLLQIAESRQMLMNEEFVNRLKETHMRMTEKDAYADVNRIVGPWPVVLKGFAGCVPIYQLRERALPPVI